MLSPRTNKVRCDKESKQQMTGIFENVKHAQFLKFFIVLLLHLSPWPRQKIRRQNNLQISGTSINAEDAVVAEPQGGAEFVFVVGRYGSSENSLTADISSK